MGIITALLILSFLVFFHELGHFTAARFFGVQVDVFSIGFGKKLLSKQIGKTEWSFSLIPLGGYVKMKGQDDSDPTLISYDEDSYNSKKPWQRIIILLAGPFANFLLAFLLYLAISSIGVPKLLPTVGDINTTNPAYEAGIQIGDKIININGQSIHYWEDIGKAIERSPSSVHITLLREHQYVEVTVIPELQNTKNMFQEVIKRPIIGIQPDINSTGIVHYGLEEGITYAYEQTQRASMLILKSLQKLIAGLVPMDQLGGVVSIVDVTAKASGVGIVSLLFFTALISVNLGVLNLLPIPALDGGHIIFNLYEMITNKVPNEEIMYKLTLFGWGLLLSIMLLGLYNDINRLIG
ncbi:RIP metalloprotease RseP [bacterium]|nr:RIP metalloprotease RseP [bacterium]MBU1958653.1 RIP metalloprotease RseP [bacterium]